MSAHDREIANAANSVTIQLSKNRSVTIALSGPNGHFPASAKFTLESYIQLQVKTFTFYVPLGVLGEFIDVLLSVEGAATERGLLAPVAGEV